MKELPPTSIPQEERQISISTPLLGKCSKSQSRSRTRSESMIDEVDLNLQEEMMDANIDHNQGAVCTSGLRDPHHI